MSGCVYSAIYKADDEIRALQRDNLIDYRSGVLVKSIHEDSGAVRVAFLDEGGERRELACDRVFMAAGAVNSTRIVLNSLNMPNVKVNLHSRGGFVMPVLSWRKLTTSWPNRNTQPGIFIELNGRLLKHWVHVQVSLANELLYQKLKVDFRSKSILQRLKRFVLEHSFVMLVNFHSDHAGHYRLWTENQPDGDDLLCAEFKSKRSWLASLVTQLRLLGVFIRCGCIPVLGLIKSNTGTYHVGASMPMKMERKSALDTDSLGRIQAWERVHVVDSAVFPSLPGTTIGLLTMANALRITDRVMAGVDSDDSIHRS